MLFFNVRHEDALSHTYPESSKHRFFQEDTEKFLNVKEFFYFANIDAAIVEASISAIRALTGGGSVSVLQMRDHTDA